MFGVAELADYGRVQNPTGDWGLDKENPGDGTFEKMETGVIPSRDEH